MTSSRSSSRARNVVRLLPEHRDRVQTLLLLKAHHERLAHEQQAALEQLLTLAYCVNLRDEQWELDEQRGLLTRLRPDLAPFSPSPDASLLSADDPSKE